METLPLRTILDYKRTYNFRFKPNIIKLQESIVEVGILKPVIISENTIITGYSRIQSAQELSFKEIPVSILNNLSPQKIFKIIYNDNIFEKLDVIDLAMLVKMANEAQLSDKDIRDIGIQYEIESLLTIAGYPEEFLSHSRERKIPDDVLIALSGTDLKTMDILIGLALAGVKLTIPNIKDFDSLIRIAQMKDRKINKDFEFELPFERINNKTGLTQIYEMLEKKIYPESMTTREMIKEKIVEFNKIEKNIRIKDYNEDSGTFKIEFEVSSSKEIEKLMNQFEKSIKDFLLRIECLYKK
ncbi:MAG: ParB N-terminal domain-containing protein [bacterium]|nr:ParB N-terminal domain-containing protein [bacterium]